MPKVETFDKDLVIKQATDVFHDKGYNATSMQDLVDATGLNRSSIYNSFENKTNMFLECLKAYKENNDRNVSKLLLKSDNAFKAIKFIFGLYLKEITNSKIERGCLIVNCKSEMANHNLSITNFLNTNQQQTLQFLEDLVGKAQEDNLINKNKSSQEYALYLFSSLQGFRMTGILIQNKKYLQSIISTILQTLI
jgi:TetR/AcrR family transcriptional repressor of nem operon